MTGQDDERQIEEPSELHRFLDLAHKLVRVPREKIDADVLRRSSASRTAKIIPLSEGVVDCGHEP